MTDIGLFFSEKNPFTITVAILSSLCVTVVLLAILINFLLAWGDSRNVKGEKKSIVATGTMMLFSFCYFQLLRYNVGTFELSKPVHRILAILG
ncbi:MAG: hypothetical protein GY757_52515, partial [bacterium]|nr:hypothetical protein [bacterium]